MRRKYIQYDWQVDNYFGFSADFLCYFIDRSSYVVEVGKLFFLSILYNFIELCIWGCELSYVIHTQFEGPSGYNTLL